MRRLFVFLFICLFVFFKSSYCDAPIMEFAGAPFIQEGAPFIGDEAPPIIIWPKDLIEV